MTLCTHPSAPKQAGGRLGISEQIRMRPTLPPRAHAGPCVSSSPAPTGVPQPHEQPRRGPGSEPEREPSPEAPPRPWADSRRAALRSSHPAVGLSSLRRAGGAQTSSGLRPGESLRAQFLFLCAVSAHSAFIYPRPTRCVPVLHEYIKRRRRQRRSAESGAQAEAGRAASVSASTAINNLFCI